MPATLGDPRAVHQGSEAYTLGNPLGLVGSMSAGVISGLGSLVQDPEQPAGPAPGSSRSMPRSIRATPGGPLTDRDGHVIGIVTALVNPTEEDVFIGIGLAVPIDVAGGAAGLPPY